MPHYRRERRRLNERQPSQDPLPDPDIDRLRQTPEERYQLDRSDKPDREKELENLRNHIRENSCASLYMASNRDLTYSCAQMKPWIEAEAEALAKEREIKGKNRYLPYGAKYPPAGGGLQRWEMWDACMKRAWNDFGPSPKYNFDEKRQNIPNL